MNSTLAQALASSTSCKPVVRLKTQDLTEVPLFELSKRADRQGALLILHATGFSGCTYKEMGNSLSKRWDVFAVDFRGHGTSKKVPGETFDWRHFAYDVDAASSYIKSLGYEELSVFGHSMGGAAAILSLAQGNQDIDKLFLFEPIIFPVSDIRPPDPDNSLAKAALRRRTSFESLQTAYDNFVSKEPLCRFQVNVIVDYLLSAFEQTSDGSVRLLCAREDESLIYAFGSAHDAYRLLTRINNKVLLLFGGETDTFDRTHFIDLAKRLPRGRHKELVDIGHFGPMTHPQLLAEIILHEDQIGEDTNRRR